MANYAKSGWLIAFSFLLFPLLSCGGGRLTGNSAFTGNERLVGIKLFSVGSTKRVSGPPSGVIVTWERSADPRAIGYYLYRDTNPIPDNPNPSLRANDGQIIPQSASGNTVVFYDRFYPQIGLEYFYRVSVVDVALEESDLSNEMSIVISSQVITGISPNSGYFGDTIVINGENFGIFDEETDAVLFPTDGDETISAQIVAWNNPEDTINVIVPSGAITGKIRVVIAGVVAESDEDFIVLSPFLTGVEPQYAAVGDSITLSGANLGDSPSGTDRIVFPGGLSVRHDEPDYVLQWSPDLIEVKVPPLPSNDGEIRVVVDGVQTNGVFFSLRPKIQALSPFPVVPGSPNVYTLSGLNLGDKDSAELYIVDLSANPVDPILVPENSVPTWTNKEVVFWVPSLSGAGLPAFRIVRNGIESNDMVFDPFAILQVAFTQPTQFSIVDSPTQFTLSLEGWEMVEKVEYYLGSSVIPIEVQENQPTYSFILNPSAMRNGRYTLSALAYRLSEVAIATITFDLVSLPGDVNADGFVDELDVEELGEFIGTKKGQLKYRGYRDPTLDGFVDERDLSVIGYNYKPSEGVD